MGQRYNSDKTDWEDVDEVAGVADDEETAAETDEEVNGGEGTSSDEETKSE